MFSLIAKLIRWLGRHKKTRLITEYDNYNLGGLKNHLHLVEAEGHQVLFLHIKNLSLSWEKGQSPLAPNTSQRIEKMARRITQSRPL
jgi:hypothetical protein